MKAVVEIIVLCLVTLVLVASEEINVEDFGAVGDGKTVNTKEIQKAIIFCCSQSTPCTVLVPEKIFLTGALNVSCNGLSFKVDGTLLGSKNESDFPVLHHHTKLTEDKTRYHPLLMVSNVSDFHLLGSGTIDGSGLVWWEREFEHKLKYQRPRILEVWFSSSIIVEGVKFKDSPYWNMLFYDCVDVIIRDLEVSAPPFGPNTDGMDPYSSRNVLVENVKVSCGDDCIAIKADDPPAPPCQNITVRNFHCNMGVGLSIGSKVSSGVKDVVFSSCSVEFSEYGLYIKTMENEIGFVENVLYENIDIRTIGVSPLAIDQHYGGKPWPGKIRETRSYSGVSQVKNVRYRNVTAKDVFRPGEFICNEQLPCDGIDMENVNIHGWIGRIMLPYKCENAKGKSTNCEPVPECLH